MSSRSIDSAPRSLEQGRVRRHVVLVHAEGVNQGGLDFLENLVVRRHDILKGITDESGAVCFRICQRAADARFAFDRRAIKIAQAHVLRRGAETMILPD